LKNLVSASIAEATLIHVHDENQKLNMKTENVTQQNKKIQYLKGV
jgi:hypothetical protein